MELNIALLIYAVVQFIAFFLVMFATPIDMFVFKPQFRSGRTPAVTLWGLKNKGFGTKYSRSIYELWSDCPGRLMRFRVAQVLAIISILVYGTAFVLGVTMLFCCPYLRFVCVALNIVGAVTLCIVWASMVVTYRNEDPPACIRESFLSNYGAGFVLLVVAWVLDILNIFVLLLPFHITVFRELDGANDKSDETSKGESEERGTQQEEEDEEYE
ncbi:Amastin surface glycoprotein, putative [Leishmania guyanensis]